MPSTTTFILRKKDSQSNPTLPDGLYGKGITYGIPFAWKFTGGNLYALIALSGGGRYGNEGIDQLLYRGSVVDPADYIFHPGTYTKQISPKVFTADSTTDFLTSNAHGYLDTNEVRVRSSGGALPAGLTQDGKYFVRDKTANTFKLATTSGGTAIDLTSNGTGTLRVWKADAGFDDPMQGRPTYFTDISETFSNICYVEVRILSSFSPTPSDAEPAATDFAIFMTGRKVMDYDDEGAELGVVTYPDNANNALVALDIAVVDMKRPLSRFDFPSFDALKTASNVEILDEIAPDEAGSGTGLAAKFWNYTGGDVPDVSIFLTTPEISRIDANVNYALQATDPATGVSATKFAAQWKGKIKPLYSETYTFYFTANDGVRIWIGSELIVDYFILTSTLTRTGTIALEADTLYDIRIEFFNNLGEFAAILEWQSASQARQVIPQIKLYPAISSVIRYQAHIVSPSPKEAFQHFDDAIKLAIGWRWTDRKGKIELLPPYAGAVDTLYSFNFDPNDDAIDSTIIKQSFAIHTLQNNRRSMVRASLRELTDPNYKETFIESISSDLTTRLQPNNGIDNDAPREYGVMRLSQGQRLLDHDVKVTNDPTEYFSVNGTRESTKLSKGVFVNVKYYKPNNKIISTAVCEITSFQRGGNLTGENRATLLPLPSYPVYSDNPVIDAGEFEPTDRVLTDRDGVTITNRNNQPIMMR